jgi:hypothetical protein
MQTNQHYAEYYTYIYQVLEIFINSTHNINFNLAGVAGIEPTIKESKSFALPLGYTPKII